MRMHTAEWKVLSAISESVDLHVGIHMKVKPYCKACDNTFRLEVSATVTIIKQLCSAQDKLKKHMKMCKRNSYCQICVFLLNLLKTHMVMHTTKVLWVLWQLSNNYVAQDKTILKSFQQLGCTGKENVKTAGSHENAHLWQLSKNYVAQIVTISKNSHRTTPQEIFGVYIVKIFS